MFFLKGEGVTYDGYWELVYFWTSFTSAGNKCLLGSGPYLNHVAPDFQTPGCDAEGN
jgi:hypothetical protein